jgi:hypothetical protein
MKRAGTRAGRLDAPRAADLGRRVPGNRDGVARAAADNPALSRKKADARIRTADPFITSEVLYQLSYVGVGSHSSAVRT